MKKTPRKEIEERTTQTLKDLGLGEKIKKYPFQLSGGEQQRVSLARSIVYNPRLILLDEPLSNVDARLAISMRSDVKRILHSLGIASVYVTHDQEEAFVVSDRILVMNKGKIVQEGSPSDIYERPNSEFVIDFIGRSNIFHGTLRSKGAEGGEGEVEVDELGIVLKCFPPPNIEKGMQCLVALRPNEISIKHDPPPSKDNVLEGIAIERNYRGNVSDHIVSIGDKRLLVTSHRFCPMTESSQVADKVYIYIAPRAITLSPFSS
jgi:iron(III) transport system ATP-binding protein